jgi:hypothetical protein
MGIAKMKLPERKILIPQVTLAFGFASLVQTKGPSTINPSLFRLCMTPDACKPLRPLITPSITGSVSSGVLSGLAFTTTERVAKAARCKAHPAQPQWGVDRTDSKAY